MRITFISSIQNVTSEEYCKQSLPMCEIVLNKLLSRNPNLINCFKGNHFYPMIRIYSQVPLGERKLGSQINHFK